MKAFWEEHGQPLLLLAKELLLVQLPVVQERGKAGGGCRAPHPVGTRSQRCLPGPGSARPEAFAICTAAAAAGNTMQGFFCAALSGFVLQLCSLDVSV